MILAIVVKQFLIHNQMPVKWKWWNEVEEKFKTPRKETSTHLNQRAIPKTTGFKTYIPTSSRMPYTCAKIGFGLQWVAEEFTMLSLLSHSKATITIVLQSAKNVVVISRNP